MASEPEPHTVPVPGSVRFPVELDIPPGFDPADPATWPRVEGRLEYVGERLLYMPPCGLEQQGVVVSAVAVLVAWGEHHPSFFIGGNEAGMLLAGDTRGAEGAVWRREDLGPITAQYARVAPVLAVEVAGKEEGESELRAKAAWYLGRSVRVVWLLLPRSREVVVIRADGESRHGLGERLPTHPDLPGLEPEVERFFRQLG